MAFVYALASSACAWMAMYVLTSEGDLGRRLFHRVALLMPLRLVALLRRLSMSRVVAACLRIDTVVALCDELVLKARVGMHTVVREEVCAALLVASGIAMAVACLLVRSLVAVPVMLCLAAAMLPFWNASRRHRRQQELIAAMPVIFRTLAMALGSGETLAQALTYVGEHGEGAAGQAFHRASLRMRCGQSVEDVLDQLVGELDAPGVGLLATALAISQRTGSPLRSLFQRSAELVERQGEFERTLSVKTAQVRLSVRIVSLLPLVLVSVLSLLSPDFRQGLLTGTGMTCILIAALMDGAALVIIRRLMGGVL